MNERRLSIRTPVVAEVEVTSDLLGKIVARTQELSDGGAFIESDALLQLDVGTIVTLQAVGFPEEMPILEAEIVRKTDEGVGMKFLL